MPSECKSKVHLPLTQNLSFLFCCLSTTRTSKLSSKLLVLDLGKEAGLAFERAATIQTKNLNEPDDAANTLTEAYKSYRKSDPEDAARVLQQAINHYTSKGNFRRAATHQQNLAEIYEIEIGDEKRAVDAYEIAAGWFESDHAEACVLDCGSLQFELEISPGISMLTIFRYGRLANKLFLKVADLAATSGDYYKSIEHYERVAKSSVSNNLMKWSVKDYFLKAGICHLAANVSLHNFPYLPFLTFPI